MTDWYLIRRFRDDRSEAAFSQLVSRYIKLVYSVCYAELQNAQAAEDATQAVFLILARKAEFRRGSTLSTWLFQTARYVARHAYEMEVRRSRLQCELEVMHREETQTCAMDDSDASMLTQALSALREADREALLLRYYQELSLAEVGDVLGVSEEAARKRVARGLGKMRSYLERHGAASAIGVLTAGLAIIAPLDARSEVMIHAIAQNLISTVGLAASTAANQLTLEVLKKMAMMKLKWTVACAIVIAGAGSGTAYVMGQGTAGAPGAVAAAAVRRVPPVPAWTNQRLPKPPRGLLAQLNALKHPLGVQELKLLKIQLSETTNLKNSLAKELVGVKIQMKQQWLQEASNDRTSPSKNQRAAQALSKLRRRQVQLTVQWNEATAQQDQVKKEIATLRRQLTA